MTRSHADAPKSSRTSRTLLLATDNKNSVLAEIDGGKLNPVAYSAYGQQSAQEGVATGLGFNGALRERQVGWYLLGNGYRAYNPTLMRFHSPDSWSPFGGGGLNAYMYCVGDPVNFSDPTGHMRLWDIFRSNRRTSASPNLTRIPSTPNTYVSTPTPTPTPTPTLAASPPGSTLSNIQSRPLPEIPTALPQNETPAGVVLPSSSPPPRPPKTPVTINSDLPAIPQSGSPLVQYAPIPPTRTLPSGASRQYSVTYDENGNPMQRSVQKYSLPLEGQAIRNTKKK